MGSAKDKVIAGGALVWRKSGRTLEVLLIHRPRYDDWSWPKGKLDAGEHILTCAVREVAEETGLNVQLGLPLPTVRYKLDSGKHKASYYWAAREIPAEAGAMCARAKVKPSKHEVDEVRWVSAAKAYKMLTRKSDREPLGALIDLYEDGMLDTWTVVIARHGRAKKRSAYKGGEDTRPMTSTGEKQSKALVPLLASYGIDELITSPWARCHDTLVPYAKATGLDLITAPQITEHAAKKSPRDVRALVSDLLSVRHPATVVCTHRPVMPTILSTVERKSPHRVLRVLPEGEPYLRTGEILVLHLARPHGRKTRVISMEMHRP